MILLIGNRLLPDSVYHPTWNNSQVRLPMSYSGYLAGVALETDCTKASEVFTVPIYSLDTLLSS